MQLCTNKKKENYSTYMKHVKCTRGPRITNYLNVLKFTQCMLVVKAGRLSRYLRQKANIGVSNSAPEIVITYEG